MEIVKKFIEMKKKEVNVNDEKEYERVLDLITTGKPILEEFAVFFSDEVKNQLKK